MDDLAAFVTARLDEDEAAAKAAIDSAHRDKCAVWIARPDGNGYVIGDETGHFAFCLVGASEGGMAHVIRHDPARVRREAAADRKLLAAYAEVARYDTDDPEPEFASGRAAGLGEAVRIRAERFSDHPDYRPEWKPPDYPAGSL